MRYLSYYQLGYDPFQVENEDEESYESISFNQMRYRLEYLKEVKGIGLFTGSKGTGKTYTLKSFVRRLPKSLNKVMILTASNLTQFEMLLQIALGLGLNAGNYFKSLLEDRVKNEIIRIQKEENKNVIIIIDNAEYLPITALVELQYLTEFGFDENRNLIIVIIGNEDLKKMINQRKELEGLRQRITVNYQMVLLTKEETESYIKHKLENAGCKRELFNKATYNSLYQVSGGNIRKLNKLVSACLLLGYQKDEKEITLETIMDAKEETLL